MQLRIWASLLIFISSYSPLALIIFVKDINTNSWTLQHPVASCAILVAAILSILLLMQVMKLIRQGYPVKVTRVANQSGELVNYSIPYMISFFGFDLGDGKSVAAFLIFMGLMFFLTVRTQNIFINPILSLLGYGLYDVEYEEKGVARQATFLSKEELRSGETCLLRKVTRFLYVVTQVRPSV